MFEDKERINCRNFEFIGRALSIDRMTQIAVLLDETGLIR
jgi:hypothetical protein